MEMTSRPVGKYLRQGYLTFLHTPLIASLPPMPRTYDKELKKDYFYADVEAPIPNAAAIFANRLRTLTAS